MHPILSILFSVGLSAGGLYLAFRNIPVSQLMAYFPGIDYSWMLPAVAAILTSYLFRVHRWRIILLPAGRIKFREAFSPLMIAFAANCIFPGRVGELVRPALLKKSHNIPMMTGIATVALERVMDLIMILLFFSVVSFHLEIDPDLDIVFGEYHLRKDTLLAIGYHMVQMCIVMIAAILLICFRPTRHGIVSLFEHLPDTRLLADRKAGAVLRKWICSPLVNAIRNMEAGFEVTTKWRSVLACMGYSIILWGLMVLSCYLVSRGCPGIGLSYWEIGAHMVILCFFIALPSVPGFWGIWEAGGVFALSMLGVAEQDAAGFTLVNHVVQIVPVVLVGLACAVYTGVGLRQMTRRMENR